MGDALRIRIPAPNDKQKEFFRAKEKYIAYGGARGGGKSWAVRVQALRLGFRYAGIDLCIIRRTYPELEQNHIKPFLKLLPREAYKYNDSKKRLSLPNGSTITFRYCDSDKDLLHFQGAEWDCEFIDEATQFTEEQFKVLAACVRGVNEFPKHVYLTCNPGGVGHQWMRRLFIDRQFRDKEDGNEYKFIAAGVRDNKALMKEQPDYIRQLEALPPKLRSAWLDGSWDQFEGMFFEDFCPTPDITAAREAGCTDSAETLIETGRWVHVIKPYDMSSGEYAGWKIYRSYDFGFGAPFSCAWWAVDYDGRLYRIMEFYGWNGTANEGLKWAPDKQFEEIARIEREHPWLQGKRIQGVADPAIWNASYGESIAQTAAKYRVYFDKGDNNRIAGWMQVHYRLQFDEKGYPRMYIFDNCTQFIRTIPLMQYSRYQREDMDTNLEDHIADETRYMCMTRPISPVRTVERDTVWSDPLNQYKGG